MISNDTGELLRIVWVRFLPLHTRLCTSNMEVRAIKRLTEPCRLDLTAYCPTMDLVATVSEKQGVDVWRKNGQRVFGLPANDEGDSVVEGLAWKSDGQMLAVAFSDGLVSLVDSFTGKAAHKFRVRDGAAPNVPDWSSAQRAQSTNRASSTLSWSSHFVSSSKVRSQLEHVRPAIELDDLFGLNADTNKLLKASSDLPRELANLDIETSLPKLATLPATGADDDIFSSRTSIDAIFHARNVAGAHSTSGDDLVDVLVSKVSSTTIHIRIFNSFEIGTIDVSRVLPKGLQLRRVVQIASHPLTSKLYVLLEAEADGPATEPKQSAGNGLSLHLIETDLRFIPQTGYNLTLVATKATQLQNLLRYLIQISNQLSQEVRTAFDLPSRFLRNINESLAEEDSGASFTTAAYHLVVTGQCDGRFKEWLVEEVGERGLKRWEKAVGDCLDLIRRMASECLLPAIERCQLTLSRLDGLARFSETANKLGLDEKLIRPVRDLLDVLTLLCEDMLNDVCLEVREFAAFMRWIKWEAEVEALEEASERAEEMRESYNGEAELRTVLDYVGGPMNTSRVLKYVSAEKEVVSKESSQQAEDAQYYADYEKARKSSADDQMLPKLGDVLLRLQARSQQIFGHIAGTLKTSVLSHYMLEMPAKADSNMLDVRVIPADDDNAMNIHVLARGKSDASVLYIRISGGQNSSPEMIEVQQRLPRDTEDILDVKFVDDKSFIVLGSFGGDRFLAESQNWTTSTGPPVLNMCYILDTGMKAGSIVVNGRKGRKAVTVLDEARMGFVVMSLEESWR